MKTILIMLLAVITSVLLFAEQPLPRPRREAPRKQHSGRERRNQHNLWRAFIELSDAERKEMFKLQRNDPEKFKEIMQKKVDAIIKADKQEREKLFNFTKLYKNAKTEEEKAVIKKKTAEILKKRFLKRLKLNRKHLEGMKRRTARLEKELDKREANTDKIVQVQTEAILSGKFPFKGHRRGPRSPRKPAMEKMQNR